MSDKGMKKALRLTGSVLVNAIIVLLIVKAFMASYHFSYNVFSDQCYNAAATTAHAVTIPPESSSMEIVTLLEDEGIVENKYEMLMKLRLSKYYGKLLPGTYALSPSMNGDQIMRVLSGNDEEEESKS